MKTYKDFPVKSPCDICGISKWRECYDKAKACDKLWDWLAWRGDWVLRQELIKNRKRLGPPKPRSAKNSRSIRK